MYHSQILNILLFIPVAVSVVDNVVVSFVVVDNLNGEDYVVDCVNVDGSVDIMSVTVFVKSVDIADSSFVIVCK